MLLTTDPQLDRIALMHTARQLNIRELAVARRVMKVDIEGSEWVLLRHMFLRY